MIIVETQIMTIIREIKTLIQELKILYKIIKSKQAKIINKEPLEFLIKSSH